MSQGEYNSICAVTNKEENRDQEDSEVCMLCFVLSRLGTSNESPLDEAHLYHHANQYYQTEQ
jgi:hypothetical protein